MDNRFASIVATAIADLIRNERINMLGNGEIGNRPALIQRLLTGRARGLASVAEFIENLRNSLLLDRSCAARRD